MSETKAQPKIETVMVCYTQATADNLAPRPDDDEEPDEAQRARYVATLAEKLMDALRHAGCMAEIARVPQRSFAPRDISKAAFAWRILDLKESNGRAIDMALCLDFPAWALPHPRKAVWLTALPNFVIRSRLYIPEPDEQPVSKLIKIGRSDAQTENSRNVLSLLQAERRGLAESARLLAGSRQVAEDLARRGLQVEFNPLPPDLNVPPGSPDWQNPVKRLLNIK
jgi:hypothetical protein